MLEGWRNGLKRERVLIARALLLLVLLLVQTALSASGKDEKGAHWLGTWASSPQAADADAEPPVPGFADCTLRQVVHVSAGGTRIRVRFSNAFGAGPLTIVSAHVAKAEKNGAIEPASDRPLMFQGSVYANIPAGALMYSDPVDFDLPALSDLAVTMRLKGAPDAITTHPGSRATSYFAQGDAVSAPELPAVRKVEHWYFLNGVDVMTSHGRPAAVVILGDSITDGKNSTTNGNGRWPDDLARRLHAAKRTANVGVLNEGIGGNRLLDDGAGPNALARLDRDVLAQAGAHWLVLFEGVNDIGTCKNGCDMAAVAQEMIGAYQQIIVRAHVHGIRVYGATITPFGESFYASPGAERARQTVNQWIRSSGRFDAVIDFDAALRDSSNPSNLSSEADSGDHLHPADAGYQRMADSIALKIFEK
jgi:lysophospholipase L1-like esterase